MSPFEHPEDVASVEPIDGGVTVRFRPVPGLTADRLTQVLNCHLARNASLGNVVPEMPSCPLVPRGVTVAVEEKNGAFSASIRSTDDAVAAEIASRAAQLLTAP